MILENLNKEANFLGRAPLDGCTAPEIVGQCTARAQIDVVFLLDTTDESDNIGSVKTLIREIATCLTVKVEHKLSKVTSENTYRPF